MTRSVIASCLCRRCRYCSRIMNRTGLKPKPTLTPIPLPQSGRGRESPRPFGERGGGEGQAVIDTNTGQFRFMERSPTLRFGINFTTKQSRLFIAKCQIASSQKALLAMTNRKPKQHRARQNEVQVFNANWDCASITRSSELTR